MVLTAFPQPIAGPQLRAERKRAGIQQKDIAERIGIKRNQVYLWEQDAELDLVRSTRYQEALKALTAEKLEAARA